MMLLKADARTEAGVLPCREDFEAMGKYNEELIKAGVMLDGAGLQPTSKGAKIVFRRSGVEVTDGPFAETKEIIAGYWMIQVASRAEAIAWASKAPVAQLPHEGRDPEIELRQMFELEDFADVPPAVLELEKSFGAGRPGRK
jgi:hypothetical protein